ncbi:uncharacterized protein UHOD_11191 [Ustilago sp. UG-2017b]|nr:uncharacterized protein UHOD_11191 [Ustilago sp. UG-2017b]
MSGPYFIRVSNLSGVSHLKPRSVCRGTRRLLSCAMTAGGVCESTFFIEYCAGGPSSATPVLLSCVASFDTAPPPQDLLAGLLYTAPPPSTGDGSFDSYLSSP